MTTCDGCPYPLDGKGHAAGCLRDAVERLQAQLFDATRRADGLEQDVAHWRERAEEREADMHLRIRAGYDKTIADSWRAEVAKVTERAERAEARARELGGAVRRHLVTSYGVWDRCLVGEALARGVVIDVITCECGARVEGQGRDPSKVRLPHRNGCLMLTVEALGSNSEEKP